MFKSYYLPSLFYLSVTAASGIWIRMQWAEPGLLILNPRYLIHAHSHLAMLGWLFLALAGLIAQFGMNTDGRKKMNHPLYLALLHLSISGMTVAFALQGYAFYSILLSTLFVFLSLWFAVLYFRYEDMQVAPLVRNFLNAAVFWMVFSSVAPLALAAGTMMGPEWIQGWVAFYLHLQFNGWITFALAGLIIANFGSSRDASLFRTGRIAFWLLFIGLLPSFEPLYRHSYSNPFLTITGITGSLMVLTGTALLFTPLIKEAHGSSRETRILFIFALCALLLKSLFHAMASAPGLGEQLVGTHFFAIGFVHLLLLAFATTAIIALFITRFMTAPVKKGTMPGIWLYLAGASSTIIMLFAFGAFQFLQKPLFIPVQWLLFLAGVPVLLGCLMLFLVAAFNFRDVLD